MQQQKVSSDFEKTIIEKTATFVKNKFLGEGSGHDWWHIDRVWKNAIKIGSQEKADMFIVQLGALLHDIADWKFYDGDEDVGPKVAREFLSPLNISEKIIEHVCQIIKDISFKGICTQSKMKTIEGMVVQDADRLDAMGAIGVARVFTYGGFKQREIYNSEIKPVKHETSEQYKNNTSPSINHFYEKLLFLKDLMNTTAGKIEGQKRHDFMMQYLHQFFYEVGDKPF